MSNVYLATGEFTNKNINEKFTNINKSTINVCGNYICGTSTNGDIYRCSPPCHGNQWELISKGKTESSNDEQFYKKYYEKLLKENEEYKRRINEDNQRRMNDENQRRMNEEKQKKDAEEKQNKYMEEKKKKDTEEKKKKEEEIEKENKRLFGNPIACDKYKENENNISYECWEKLWKDARCTTNPPKMEDHKNLTLKEVKALTDEYASKNNKIYRQACYGDESKYPAVRLYVTDKKNLRDGNYTPINFSIGVHSTHNFIVNSIIISPDHKVSIYKNNDLSGEYRTFFHSVSNLDDFKMKDETKFWHDNIKSIQVEKIQPIMIKNYCIDYEPNDYVTEEACINQLWKDNGCTDGYPSTLNNRLTFDVLKKEIKKIGDGKDDKSLKLCYGFDKEKWPVKYGGKPIVEKNNTCTNTSANSMKNNKSYKPKVHKINNNETCKDKCNESTECVAYNSIDDYDCYIYESTKF